VKEKISNQLISFNIVPPNPPNDGILFVDHSKKGRSGHLGHALIEYKDEKILAFYPNCSEDNDGHSAVGWMEYKRSENGGQTWSEPIVLEYSRNMFDEGKGCSTMSEKAVLAPDGTIVLFNLVCDIQSAPKKYRNSTDISKYPMPNAFWEPHYIPTYIRSFDGGYTWTDAKNISDKRGRVFDALSHDDSILALQFCNDASERWTGTTKEHVYSLFTSTDNGETFYKKSELPFNTKDRGYGTMEVLSDGGIIVYIYNINDEQNLEYTISYDNGYTWAEPKTAYFEKKIRNPQMVSINGCYFLHGRSGHFGEGSGNFVLYSSRDGILWDAGIYLRMQEAGHGAYSNNLVVGKYNSGKSNRLLIQASHAYEQHKTNIVHWWLENISIQK